jgi:hypothetical protein
MSERGLTIRSILLGLCGGTLICLFAPYSDLAMQNTPLVGNNLPLGVMLILFVLAVFINGPLNRFKPTYAFSGYELAVTLTLMLAMCSIPSTGLMRYLLPNLAVPFVYGVEHSDYRALLSQLGLSKWIFPQFEGDRPADWIGDPLATGFYYHWADPDRSPYGAWVVPFFTWGIFVAALGWALISTSCLVIHQWRHNEHLAFPLVNIQLALVEAPAPKRWLNRVLSQRSFWIAFVAVMLLHVNNGFAQYYPKYVPLISNGFDLTNVLKEPPWNYSEGVLRKSTIYFSMVGIAFFLSGPVAFSLWFFVIVMQSARMISGALSGEPTILGIDEQRHGAALAMFIALIWVGRHHLAMIGGQMVRGVRSGEHQGDYLSYRVAAWGLIVALGVLFVWLLLAGATVLTSLNLIIMLMIGFVLITRLIAETGIIHGAMPTSLMKPLSLAGVYFGIKPPVDGTYMNALTQATFYDYREVLSVYTTHGMRNIEETRPANIRPADRRRDGRRLIGWIAVAVMLAYVVSYWSSLWVNYNYGVSLDLAQKSPIDIWGIQDNPRWQLLSPAVTIEQQNFQSNFSRAGYLGLGFGIAGVLSVCRLLFSWWPLHPVGYLIYGTFPSTVMWFSIFLGWVAKRIVLRLGSATFYEKCKPFFIGLILGEVGAGAFWLIVSIVLHAMGIPYRSILVLPQ